ncbi:MAG TPA: hypothetical protein VK929_02165 [Longimicrobiales bacterium]|nr:hypothetical protein [Longimicrobiales bacterium]
MRSVPSAVVSLLLTAAVVGPAHVHGQYGAAVADTLRYAEITRGSVDMDMPGGRVSVRSVHDAVVAVTFPTAGEARAWYVRLSIESAGPAGAARPGTEALLGQPFDFTFLPTGQVQSVKAPAMPAEIAAITDLTRQFDDFFITLPPGELVIGATWADTVINEEAAREVDRTTSRHIRSYAVERDTTVAGVPAFVIRVHQASDIEASSEMPEENMTVSSRLTGTDEGWAVFAPGPGRLLERHSSGSLTGEMRLQPGGMEPVTVPQSYTYQRSIRLVPPEVRRSAASETAPPSPE